MIGTHCLFEEREREREKTSWFLNKKAAELPAKIVL